MPLKIDPAWEYWVPDEEISEILESNERRGLSKLGELFGEIRKPEYTNIGFRFGRGNPNKVVFRLARASCERIRNTPELPDFVKCKGCGETFQPDRHDRYYCKRSCVPHAGRKRLLDDKACGECGNTFRPKEAVRKFCSSSCATKNIGRLKKENTTNGFGKCSKSIQQAITVAYLRGDSITDIATRYGVSIPTIKRLKRALQLPPRPTGRPRST